MRPLARALFTCRKAQAGAVRARARARGGVAGAPARLPVAIEDHQEPLEVWRLAERVAERAVQRGATGRGSAAHCERAALRERRADKVAHHRIHVSWADCTARLDQLGLRAVRPEEGSASARRAWHGY